MSSLAGKVLGRYYILEQIGLGGVATVYRCVDLERDQTVAVKVLSSHLAATPQFKERFDREVKVLRALQHPHIVPILDHGEFDDQPFIVMPFYTAGTLSDRLQSSALSAAEAARIVNQLAEALEFAHQQGIVHRDLKPSNILLDDDGNVFLSDFGFAHITDASLSLTGSGMIGTPAYMSPEQCKGEPIDPRSDQYSLGVLLHQLTTGRLPYSGETPMAIAIKHVNEPLTPPRKVTPNLPEPVERVLVKALAKNPHERFASVAELNAAFQAALAGVVDRNGEVAPPRADPDHPTVPMSRRELLARLRGGRTWKWRRAAGLALLLTLVCAPLAWAMAVAPPVGLSLANGSGAAYVTPTDLMATIYALSTDLARPQGGDRLSSGEIATAVAGTLTARGALPTDFEAGAQPLGGTIDATEPTRPTVAFIPRTATPSRTPASGGGATATASRTPTATPTPTATEFGQPSDTPTRTPTRTPTPTDAPTPSNTPVTPPTLTPVTPPTPTPVTPTSSTPPTVTPAPTIKPQHCNLPHRPTCTPSP